MPTREPEYFIIEHPTRGTLQDLEWTPNETQYGRFSNNGSRAEAMRFATLGQAERAREQIHPPRLRQACQIRRSTPASPSETGMLAAYNAWPVIA